PTHRRVLIVEDRPDAREALRLLLEAEGHEVAEAGDGRAGLDRLLAWRPEIALVDVGLPELDGDAPARAGRTAPGTARILLVAVPGSGQPQSRQRAFAAGFDAHLPKPVDLPELLHLLAVGQPPSRRRAS